MRSPGYNSHSLEILEARIAPANAGVAATVRDAELSYDLDPLGSQSFVSTKTETPLLLKAGQVLTTGVGARSGTYLLFVEQGEALIFTSDFNNNKLVDFNEITGIAAGAGLRLISFVDIDGDIVTNLDADRTLTDSNNSTIGDDPFLKGDGRLLNNVGIEKIELRSLSATDLSDQNADGVVDDIDVSLRISLSSYSIHGNILMGGNFGVVGDANSGLIIDDTGRGLQSAQFSNGTIGTNYFVDFKPTIGSIKTGSAASGEYFSFSITAADDVQGTIKTFTPLAGQNGGDITTVRAADPATPFNIRGLFAGDGGVGARGGNIDQVLLSSDTAGGYLIVAGNGGPGRTGGAGGSITNFSDNGSITSQVTIKSGDGGIGSAGVGGNGGTIDLKGNLVASGVALNVNGGVSVILGDGGQGFTVGGNGASLTRGTITTPEGTAEFGRSIIGSTHDGRHDILTGKLVETGIIGRTKAVDFDGDGFGDIVFTTSEAEQLVVQFGDGNGGYRTDPVTLAPIRLYLDAPIGAEALTVADFNGDGHQDIAAASSAPGSFGGIFVYLSHYEDANNNGLSKEEDLNGNNKNDFVGFFTPRQTPLPTLNAGDPDGGAGFDAFFDYRHSAHAINDLEVGDFDGDGFTDIAVLATYITTGLNPGLNQVLIFMRPDVEDGRPTGEFYANFGTKAIAQPAQGANPLLPFTPLGDISGGGGKGTIEATALSTSATTDIIIGISVDNNIDVGGISSSQTRNFIDVWDNSQPRISGPTLLNTIAFEVDSNRDIGGDKINIIPAFLRDITVVDFDSDGAADFAAISEEPAGFLVAAQGNGAGGATIATENFTTVDNSGYFFGQKGLGIRTEQRAIRVSDADGDGLFDEVAILDYDPNIVPIYRIDELQITLPPLANTLGNPGAVVEGFLRSLVGATADAKIIAFDIFFSDVSSSFSHYSVALPSVNLNLGQFIEPPRLSPAVGQPVTSILTPLAQHYFTLRAGDGGDALIGRGGIGGRLGDSLATGLNLVGSLDITFPVNRFFDGEASLIAGDGGQGFTTGGNGGSVSGVAVHYPVTTNLLHSFVSLFGGDGGIGVAGAGGNGGDLRSNSIETGLVLIAGNGGPGLTGGNGGSITGHGIAGFFDNRHIFQSMNAGSGGDGILRGGAGGSITNFKGLFNIGFFGVSGGLIQYVAGNGGSASSGPGGDGGSVLNDSPLATQDNFLAGDILLQGGEGGNGSRGGDGGTVANFVNNPTTTDNPAVLSVLAGSGGRGIAGPGGDGGNVLEIKTPTRGIPNPFVANAPPATAYTFNRILAGNGGLSAGGAGGEGGSISTIESKNEENPFVLVAGSGGGGLSIGGAGGSIKNAKVSVGGSTFAKGLFIAGEGGSAAAFLPGSPDQGEKAFGGRIGQGGRGGDILFTTQSGTISSRADFIAGNGGDTVNYGTIADTNTGRFVGQGGSVRGILADGTIGNILGNIPITSYNDIRSGETLTDFVNRSLRDPVSAGSVDDSFGNVGIVVGAAGRLKEAFAGYDSGHNPVYESNPAAGALNGSLSDVTAREIMSAVAGNVERIAAIQFVSNVIISGAGEFGVDKTVGDPVNYLDKDGNPTPFPRLDGELVDGALISRTQATQTVNGKLVPVNYPGNSFVIS